MVKLLLTAAFISLFVSYFSSLHVDSKEELPIWIEPLVIFLILIANGLIGLYQDYSADKSVETLKSMLSNFATVKRDNKWTGTMASDLAVGDVVKVKMGEVVPADLRII